MVALVASSLLAAGCEDGDRSFTPFVGADAPPDVRDVRLCAASNTPDEAADTTFIDCELEGGHFAPMGSARPASVRVLAYNFERGLDLDAQIDAIQRDPDFPPPDVILASEVDRGCSRTGYRDVTRDLAEALQMDYVFGVEFVELPRDAGGGGAIDETCEHGNAILSRYPIGNVALLRHAQNRSWYIPPEERDGAGEPRLGGRMALRATVDFAGRAATFYVVHFESSLDAQDIQAAQAVEIAEDGLAQPGPVVVGGDTNAFEYWLDLLNQSPDGGELLVTDPTVRAFLDRGYVDAHAGGPLEERTTRGPFVLDLLFGLNASLSEPGICRTDACAALSDHLPVWATLTL